VKKVLSIAFTVVSFSDSDSAGGGLNASAHETIVSKSGNGNMADDGTEIWVEIGGSGFFLTLKANREQLLTGSAGETIQGSFPSRAGLDRSPAV
jgi:hypothetical protein